MGTSGISYGDCVEVRDATDAVEMDLDPAANPAFSPDPPMCPYSFKPGTILYSNDFETNISEWSTTTLSGTTNDWIWLNGYATSGNLSRYAADIGSISDSVAWTNSPVALAANVYLHFRHSFGFESESDGSFHYDGGVIEYSTDGSTWLDLGSLFDDGQDYGGIIDSDYLNPLAGRSAFVNESHGYVATRYDLSSLAGQNFQVRFRVGSDETFGGPLGWAFDDINLYQCVVDFDASCSGDDVLIQSREFTGNTKCVADSSLMADTAVIIKTGATVVFDAPSSGLNQGFAVEVGSTFSVVASP